MAKGAGEAGENPLVPNAKLRQMYTAMLEARVLEEAVAKRARGAKGRKRPASIRGQEAVRVSTAIELAADDLVSDVAPSAAMGLILGGEPASLLRSFSSPSARAGKALARGGERVLPGIDDAEERLHMAVGAAAALKTQGRRGVLVAYVRKGEMSSSAWRKILGAAAKLELPMIFVVLPRTGGAKKGDELAVVCGAAHAAGVPGMPVDACDAVALYRVVQESLGRMRGGDGPVLMECVGWRMEGRRGAPGSPDDPLAHLKQFLLARKVCTSAWFDRAGDAARRRLLAKKGASKNV